MDLRSVLNILGNLLLVLGGAMVLPLMVALGYNDRAMPLERYEVSAFFAAVVTAVCIGIALRSRYEVDFNRVGHREGAAVVTFTWLVFSLIGAMPLMMTGAAGFTDAYYETLSGFTTTGASIFTRLDHLPHGLMFWRCQTQWMGGMGIVVLSVAILPLLGVGGYRMFKAEVPGGATFERNAPRIKDIAKVLWILYLGMTVAEITLLRLGGMTLYDAICHAFTTMSTGGYSTSGQSVAGWSSPFVQWTIVLFMFLAGANFGHFEALFSGDRRSILADPELRLYVGISAVVIALVFWGTWTADAIEGGVEATLRGSAFQVVSIGTTTGYGTEDFNLWPDPLRLLLLLMMFVGGCSGSTGGGIKVVRLVIFFKACVLELQRSINPRAVLVARLGRRPLDNEIVSNVMAFLAMYLALFVLSTVILSFLGMDLLSSSSATAANLGNIGPGLGTVGPTANFAHVPTLGKWVLILCQLLGRLELYSVMVLLLPRTWVR